MTSGGSFCLLCKRELCLQLQELVVSVYNTRFFHMGLVAFFFPLLMLQLLLTRCPWSH